MYVLPGSDLPRGYNALKALPLFPMLSDLDQVISLVWASALPEQKEKDKGV